MKEEKKKTKNREGWLTTKKERFHYYIGDLGRTLEGYIVTAFMTLFLLFQGIDLLSVSAAAVGTGCASVQVGSVFTVRSFTQRYFL